jgi:hypothetical protein
MQHAARVQKKDEYQQCHIYVSHCLAIRVRIMTEQIRLLLARHEEAKEEEI